MPYVALLFCNTSNESSLDVGILPQKAVLPLTLFRCYLKDSGMREVGAHGNETASTNSLDPCLQYSFTNVCTGHEAALMSDDYVE